MESEQRTRDRQPFCLVLIRRGAAVALLQIQILKADVLCAAELHRERESKKMRGE